MKKSSYIVLSLVILLALMTAACKQKESSQEVKTAVELNEQAVLSFAHTLVHRLEMGDASALNDAMDKAHIKMLISDNSIVYSGFDVEGGQAYFEHALQLGDQVVRALDDGGDFAFVRYYLDDNGHHAVFRIYNNYIVDFYDCQLDTVDGKIMVEDCYVYSLGANLSDNIKYNMLYNLLLQTNPDSEAQWLREAEELTAAGKHLEAVKTLEQHQEQLKDYPLFYQLYIVNLYQHNPKTFIAKMEGLGDQMDPRHLLFHKLHYYYAQGDAAGAEETINSLILYTGDDPMYLFLQGQAYENAKQYDKAIQCYEFLNKSMPLFWDLWQSELKCYKILGDTAAYRQCVKLGDQEFGPAE
ncbi:MAG: hypothetical protein J5741_05890 [Bacteroidales bacterium]|nr:hypothetical protein [Bacteroidales bacterium]